MSLLFLMTAIPFGLTAGFIILLAETIFFFILAYLPGRVLVGRLRGRELSSSLWIYRLVSDESILSLKRAGKVFVTSKLTNEFLYTVGLEGVPYFIIGEKLVKSLDNDQMSILIKSLLTKKEYELAKWKTLLVMAFFPATFLVVLLEKMKLHLVKEFFNYQLRLIKGEFLKEFYKKPQNFGELQNYSSIEGLYKKIVPTFEITLKPLDQELIKDFSVAEAAETTLLTLR